MQPPPRCLSRTGEHPNRDQVNHLTTPHLSSSAHFQNLEVGCLGFGECLLPDQQLAEQQQQKKKKSRKKVEGMTCDLIVIAAAGGKYIHSTIINVEIDCMILPTRDSSATPSNVHPCIIRPLQEKLAPKDLGQVQRTTFCAPRYVQPPPILPDVRLISSSRCWCHRSCTPRSQLPFEER